jgi:two-component system sensor histidine kinase RegB
MLEPLNPELDSRGRWVRLRTLLNLRWVAVAGQALAVAAAGLFELALPLAAILPVLAAPVLVNLAAWRLFPPTKRLGERDAMLWLLFDVAQLTALLALTGGLTNPFSLLLIAPVTIAASVLSARSTLILASTALAAATALLVGYEPLRFADGAALRPPPLHVAGVWFALSLGVAFMAVYARRIGLEAARMADALATARLALSREQRLTAIGALAAAAAHELGTPLATIKLVAGELSRDLRDRPELQDDLALLRQQVERCGEILADLSAGGRDDAQMRQAPIGAVLEEAARPHRMRGKRLVVRVDGRPIEAVGDAQPVLMRRPEIIHGLRNLIQNAADFAASTVWVDVTEKEGALRVAVGDDGPGFKPEVLEVLGEPYVTTRGRGRSRAGAAGEAYQGMGLGLFIAKTLLERSGARLIFVNGAGGDVQDPPGPTGAIAAALWRREAVAAPRGRRAALGPNPRFSAEDV